MVRRSRRSGLRLCARPAVFIFLLICMAFLTRLFGDPNARLIKKVQPTVDRINQLELEYQQLTDDQLKAKTAEFRARLAGKTGDDAKKALEDLLPEAFATVKNAARRLVGKKWLVRGEEREWHEVHFDVQLIGGIFLHQGHVVEMKTGEGKTLVSTLPAYLNALGGNNVHIVTVNEYLVQRDSEWVGELHRFLGLTVGTTLHGQSTTDKRAAYACDITYGTNNEFGFDYLRDNMVMTTQDKAQRGLHYAIVDEVDSILIDEARTPLIISGPAEASTDLYEKFVRIVPKLAEGTDYNVDEKARAVTLTEDGLDHLEKLLGMGNIYNEGGIAMVHHLEAALKAYVLYKRDRDYIVKDNEVVIVDEFTGRLMAGRRYSEGLHQAIEAKEGVVVQRENRTLATITFQNYFRMFDKLAGMTGTASTQAEEFSKVYKLEVTEIPPNRAVVRADQTDRIFKTEKGKFEAVVRDVAERAAKGQPVLIGTISIEKSETLSALLSQAGVKHEVLNAKQHEREAKIVERAGERGAVTIATNMAGRGTDIKLGEGVRELGGLHVLGTERHEARRIDNQLRGRSGRQGDPGSSQFYVSLEDDLMRIFGSDRMKSVMNTLGVPDDQPIEHPLISRSLETAQRKVEANNFDVRKHLLDYDDVMNKQRLALYHMRDEILAEWDAADKSKLKERLLRLMDEEIERLVTFHTMGDFETEWNLEEIAETVATICAVPKDLHATLLGFENNVRKIDGDVKARDAIIKHLAEVVRAAYAAKEQELGMDNMRQVERLMLLRTIDTLWVEHLDAIERVRTGIGLRGYGQRDPLVEYKKEAYQMYQGFLDEVEKGVVYAVLKVGLGGPQASPLEQQNAMQLSGGNEDAIDTQAPTRASAEQKTGRNDPCFCGSGKKYKKCGLIDSAEHRSRLAKK